MGLQYRTARLKRLDKRGCKERFLEKEHHNMSILQQLTDTDADRHLFAKAQDLMNLSKSKTKVSGSYAEEESKNYSVREHRLKKDDSVKITSAKKSKTKGKKSESDRAITVKKKTKSYTLDEEDDSKRKGKKDYEKMLTETTGELDVKEDDASEDSSESEEREVAEHDISSDGNMVEEDEVSESDDESSNIIEKGSGNRRDRKLKKTRKTENNNLDTVGNKKVIGGQETASDSEGSAMSDEDDGDDRSVECDSDDSEGSVVDENDFGEKITSIWDDCTIKEEDSKSKLHSGPKFATKNISKSKGTVAVRQLDLTKQNCIDDLLQEKSGEGSSDSEEEDFFIRESDTKKRRRTKGFLEGEGSDVDTKVDDNLSSEGSDDDDGGSRGRYLDKNFKKIWGQGMEDTIRLSRGRRGGGKRGRFVDDRGGSGFYDNQGRGFNSHQGGRFDDDISGSGFDDNHGRGFRSHQGGRFNIGRGRGFSDHGRGNANLMPLGNKEAVEQAPGDTFMGKREYNKPGWKDKEWKGQEGSFRKFDESISKGNQFFGGRRGRQDHLGWRGRKFEKGGHDNPNRMPVSESKFNVSSERKESTQSSLLHPSWMAKQKERQMAASLNVFQGQKKTFDFDD